MFSLRIVDLHVFIANYADAVKAAVATGNVSGIYRTTEQDFFFSQKEVSRDFGFKLLHECQDARGKPR